MEDKASGTQLIQELRNEGFYGVKEYKPEGDKVMRLHAQTATIENGFVYLPQSAPWLAEYLHELTTFPNAKYDDQSDSTAQALDWIKTAGQMPGWILWMRDQAEQHRLQVEGPLVRLKAPVGVSHVDLLSRERLAVGPDGTIEVSQENAKPLIRGGWARVA